MTEPAERTVRRRARPLGLILAIAGPTVILVIGAWQRRWTTDDAFINFRIVDQLVAGHGPVFNQGERVEAYTSPLWLGVLAVGRLLPWRIEYVSIALSISLSAAGIVLMSLASYRMLRPTIDDALPEAIEGTEATGAAARAARIWWLPAGTLVLVALPPVWDFATAGLETGLTLAWIGALALALAYASERPDQPPWWALVVAGLGPLIRPECAIPSAAVLVVIAARSWRASGVWSTARRLAIALAIPFAYQLFRMAYFATLVPNTALAKAASFTHWRQGWGYLTDFAWPYVLVVPVAALAVGGFAAVRDLPAGRRVTLAVLPVAGALQALFIVRAGGDYARARLLLPPLFALVAPFALLPVRFARLVAPEPDGEPADRPERRWRPALVAPAVAVLVVGLWAVMVAGWVRPGGVTTVGRSFVTDGRQAFVDASGIRNPVTAEQQGWGKSSAPAARIRAQAITVGSQPMDVTPAPGLDTPMVAIHGVGVSGYSVGTGVYVLDQLGLGDPITSRFRLTKPGLIGHEKPQPMPWLAARLSEDPIDPASLGGSGFALPLYVSAPGRFPDDVDAARRALECRPLRDLHAALSRPLTIGRAASNVWHSFANTRLQIDPDPHRAERELC
jgi:arabinofuranosyltransferase